MQKEEISLRSSLLSSGLLVRVVCLVLVLTEGLAPNPAPGVSAGEACAQVTAAVLRGTVQDQTGAVVPNVLVTVMNMGTGVERQSSTDSNGFFVITLFQPGEYALTVEMPGFTTVTDDLVVEAGANRVLTITLRPRPLSASISVKAGASNASAESNHIDTSGSSLTYSITGTKAQELPVWSTALGRNGLAVLPFLVPGVSPTSVTGSADALVNRLGSQMSVNGSRPSSVSFNIEGGDNNDHEFNRASSPLPNPDVLQEFTISTNNYQADQGRSSGGIINAVIKPGTAKYSGNARYYLINEALNARGFFDRRAPIERLNTFGGQMGGPVVIPKLFSGQGRTFFFADYEETSYTQERSGLPVEVFTERERSGDFSMSSGGSVPRDPVTGRFLPEGIIPPTWIAPQARLYIDRFIPLPNEGERLFRQLLLDSARTRQLTSRVDSSLGRADSLSAVLVITSSSVSNGIESLPVGSKQAWDVANANLTLRETHTFSSRSLSQVTVTLTNYKFILNNTFPGASGLHPEEVGFFGVRPQSDRFLSLPMVRLNTLRVNEGSGNDTKKTAWQIKEDVSLIRAGGSFKLGAEAQGFTQRSFTASNNGNFLFSNVYTGNLFADFLIGAPSSFTQTSGSSIYPRQRAYYFYGLDDWRVRSNVTLNLGLRYEVAPPLTDKLDQVTAFRPGQRSERFPDAPLGLLFAGDPDPLLGRVPRGVYPTDRNNLAPRIGGAYSPKFDSRLLRFLFGSGKSALRAGAGVFYDHTYGGSFTRFSFVQPFSVAQLLSVTQIRVAGGTFANPFGRFPNPWPIDLSKRTFTATPDTRTLDPGFRTAHAYQYNFTLQRELPRSLLVEMAYVGSTSLKLNRARELNDPTPPPIGLPSGQFEPRIYSHLGSILSQESGGRARYDSFQLRVTRRAAKGLTLDGSYVFGKSLDNGSRPDQTSGPDQLRWARSSFDRRHNFVVSYSYSLPTIGSRGWTRWTTNGWQVGGITELRSGMPIDIAQYPIILPGGQIIYHAPDLIGPYKRFNPRLSRTVVVGRTTRTGNFFFDPAAFREVAGGLHNPGVLGRNMFDGPGIALSSLSLIKRLAIAESQHLTLRCDIRNLFNRAHFESPWSTLASSAFGQVSGAAPGRNIQLSLKYSF